jgi:hypothetical protein
MTASAPAKRLRLALALVTPHQMADAVALARVNTRCAQRAELGITINANSYVRLCAALGIDVVTGEAAPVRAVGDIDWRLLGLGLHLTRRMCKAVSIRAAARKIGKAVSPSMLSRVENGQAVSVAGVIAICKFIGTKPEQYTQASAEFHVRPKSETRSEQVEHA